MKMLSIISHEILEQQIKEVKKVLKVDFIINFPVEIKKIWANIEPYGLLPMESIKKIIDWIELNSNKGDYVLVEGDFGATYYIVDYCFEKDLVPIYATTKRKVNERIKDGKVIIDRTFEHVNFRRYVQYK